jgi:peptidyl-prolyl cis-trans isomerase C
MPITINGHELSDADVARELPHHQDVANPLQRATTAAILRCLLLEEADRLEIQAEDEETLFDAVLIKAAPVVPPDDNECRRFYESNPQRFTVGELVEAEHILFQVTPTVDLLVLRRRAEATLEDLLAQPERFAEFARNQSNCPSSEIGGNLGQLSRGDTVPEFDKAIFSMSPGAIRPRLLETRFGLHIVRVARRVGGRLLPYEQVADIIHALLAASRQDAAWTRYLKALTAQA